MRVHRHGLNALYAPGEVPESFMQACDLIQTTLDKHEAKKIESLKDK